MCVGLLIEWDYPRRHEYVMLASRLEPQESNSIAVHKSAYDIRLYALYSILELDRNTFTHHPLAPLPKNAQYSSRCPNVQSFGEML